MNMADVLDLFCRFSAAGAEQDSGAEAGAPPASDIGEVELASVLQLQRKGAESADFWQKLSDARVGVSSVGRSLNSIIQGQSSAAAWRAARVLAHLASMEGSPVMSLLNEAATTALLKMVRDCNVPGKAQQQQQQRGGAAEEEAGRAAAQAHSAAVLRDLAALLQTHGLATQADAVQHFAEVVGEVACSPFASGAAATAAFALLRELLRPIHGGLRDTAALVLRQLMPGLLGLTESGGAAAAAGGSSDEQAMPVQRSPAAVRADIIGFAKATLDVSRECKEAVAALSRYVVLKAPDKADFRALAAECAIALAAALPPEDRNRFVIFAARLSRTAKVAQRMLAVELAPALIRAFPEPFDPASAIALPDLASSLGASPASSLMGTPATSAGSVLSSGATAARGAGDSKAAAPATAATAVLSDGWEATPAPWGTVCLALLQQRCSDKAAAVRGKALAHLADVVRCMLAQQDRGVAHMRHCRQAGASLASPCVTSACLL